MGGGGVGSTVLYEQTGSPGTSQGIELALPEVNTSRPASPPGGGRNTAPRQGLTLVHCSAQFERFVWDTGCAWGMCSPC